MGVSRVPFKGIPSSSIYSRYVRVMIITSEQIWRFVDKDPFVLHSSTHIGDDNANGWQCEL
jgi:hypothetical protein